ncbi:MAG: OmpA family protein [Cyclobacteriaceae bacterium]
MKKLLFSLLAVFCFHFTVKAQLCCNVVDGSGVAVVATNGLCVIAPNLPSPDCAGGDSDGDGVADADDECPHEAGTAENGGCPDLTEDEISVLKAALAGVEFKTDSDELIGDSESKLDAVVALMKKHPDFKLKISGYSDNTGDSAYNLELSDKRAHAAESYIIEKGVSASRVMAKGYGEENPVADNSTAEGRAKNRRVEFELVH